MRFFGLFRAKMTTIGIQNTNIIVTNDYRQFLAHFEGFLALSQISDVKPELLAVELKVCKNGIFGLKTYLKKNFLGHFYVEKSMSIPEAPYDRVNIIYRVS